MTPPPKSGSDAQTSIRIPSPFLRRADALKARIAKNDKTAIALGGRVSRSAVLKLAIARGLEALEAEYE